MMMISFLAVAVLSVCHFTEASYSPAGSTGYSCPTLFNYYGDAYDCRKFYRCFWGEAYSFNCPEGTRWNQQILTCDHEYNVPCHGGETYVTHAKTDYDYGSDYSHDSDYGSSSSYGGEQSYQYKSYDDGYNNAYGSKTTTYHGNSGSSPGYQTQTLAYGQASNYDNYNNNNNYNNIYNGYNSYNSYNRRIPYYDYNGQPSYISYGYNNKGYYNPRSNFLAYNGFMAALGYKKK